MKKIPLIFLFMFSLLFLVYLAFYPFTSATVSIKEQGIAAVLNKFHFTYNKKNQHNSDKVKKRPLFITPSVKKVKRYRRINTIKKVTVIKKRKKFFASRIILSGVVWSSSKPSAIIRIQGQQNSVFLYVGSMVLDEKVLAIYKDRMITKIGDRKFVHYIGKKPIPLSR